MNFGENVTFLRKRQKLSQTALAEDLELSRTTLISYEKGVQPPFQKMIVIADYFKVSLDALIRYNLSALSEFQLSQIEKGFEVDVTGQRLRLLTLTVDKGGKENVEMVDKNAQAGYTAGYGDPQYIAALPKFRLPFLDPSKSYRCFQIKGDSMPPIKEGDWITGSYTQDWTAIKDATPCIIVTKDEGIVFKLVYNQMKKQKSVLLVSTNRYYKPYELPVEQIAEIWKFETVNSNEIEF